LISITPPHHPQLVAAARRVGESGAGARIEGISG
jgi:hypothetical protein